MTWQPPSADAKRQHALQLRAGVMAIERQKIASLRVVGSVLLAVGIVVAVVGTPVLALVLPPASQLVALSMVGVGAFVGGMGAYFRVLFRPLPTHLLTTGVATPAVVLATRSVGPSVILQGGSIQGNLMRHQYTLEVQPQGGAPYVVEVKTFDGPMMLAINRPPVTVYVDPKNPQSVCPDWSTVPRGA